MVSRTGGGVGTNQYQVKGVSKQQPVSVPSPVVGVDAKVAAMAEVESAELEWRPCVKCDGMGGRVEWPGFVCFACEGEKGAWVDPVKEAAALAKAQAKAAAKDKARDERRAARWDEWAAAHPELAAAVSDLRDLEGERGWSSGRLVLASGIWLEIVDGDPSPERVDRLVRDACRVYRDRGWPTPDLSALGPDPAVKTITARFRGRCPACGDWYDKGAVVVWAPGEKARHPECVSS